jgi:hypothetical protein
MLEESLDPRPHPGQFARLMAQRAAERCRPAADTDEWLRSWHDREGAWTNLRNVEHWIEYAAR